MTLIIANTDVFTPKDHLIRLDNLPEVFLDGTRTIRQIFSSDKSSLWPTLTISTYPNISLRFEKGEVKILEIE
jgi:hypothetical protein